MDKATLSLSNEDRVVIGWDRKKEHPLPEEILDLAQCLEDNQFHAEYYPGVRCLRIIRKDSALLVIDYPPEFWEELEKNYPVRKTIN